MSINSVYNSEYNADIFDWWTKNNANATTDKQSILAKVTSTTDGTYGTELINTLNDALSAVMGDLNLSATDKVTFNDLMTYRDQLQEVFTLQVQLGLAAMGLPEDAEFQLVSGSDGSGMEIITDNEEDKALIQRFFNLYPDLVDDFEKIQSINKLEEVRQSKGYDATSARSRLQMEAMGAWFSDTSSIMSFSEQSVAYYSGINTIV